MKRWFVIAVLGGMLTVVGSAFFGCSNDDFVTNPDGDPNQLPLQALHIDVDTSALAIAFDPLRAVTSVTVQFVVRDQHGVAVNPDRLRVELLLDDRPVDEEALFDSTSVQLGSDMLLYVVLDASYSMVIGKEFGNMKAAAASLVKSVADSWKDRSGEVRWRLLWFDDQLHYPNGQWAVGDIARIPQPSQGAFTKLLGAVEYAAGQMYQLGAGAGENGFAIGPLDHHMMVVFSDGKDNYSWKDNYNEGNPRVLHSIPGTTLQYWQQGHPATDKQTLLATLSGEQGPDHVHVLGFGAGIDQEELSEIAAAANGRYFRDLQGRNIAALFDSVAGEITTIQTYGAGMPLQAGDYEFTVRVISKSHASVRTEFSFPFRGGDESAGPLWP